MNQKFSIFQTVRDTAPSDEIDAEQLIKWVRSDDQKALVDAIRSAPDKDTRSKYKARLPAITASGVFSKRSATALRAHSGILVADLDLDENPQLLEADQLAAIRARLCADERIYFLFSSPSGGLKAGVRIEASCAESHKSAFASVREWFAESHGLVIDRSCSDVSRLCFLSHDPKACIKRESVVFKQTKRERVLPPWEAAPKSTATTDGTSPGDQFNERADVEGLLRSQGWTTRNGKHWTRPGKSGGISGTLGVVGDRKFYCWTSAAAPLEPNTSYSPFALYATFHHGGDFSAAAQALAAEGYGEQGDTEPLPSGAVDSIKQLVKKALRDEADSWLPKIEPTPEDVANDKIDEEAGEDFDFLAALDALVASTDDNISEMEQRAQDAVFVLPQIALMGDCTILNAGPNTGKTLLTLWMLCNRDREATKHLNIYYINADDSYNGSLEKMKLTREYGIKYLIPNQRGFDPANLSKIIKAAIKSGGANKMVIVLDTLKKFVSTMDKNDARVFNIMVRSFTQAGGTLIALAHTNKNKDSDGQSIAEGVGDFHSDFDCAYTIDRAPVLIEGGERTVVFRNTKLRGPNSMKATFAYDAGERRSWGERFASVKALEEEELRKAEEQAREREQLQRDQRIIAFIQAQLEDGPKSHTALTQNDRGDPETGSRKERSDVLDRYVDKMWGKSRGQNGGYNYHSIQVGNLVRFGL
jgi:hypothetical protein